MKILPQTKAQWARTLVPLAALGLAIGGWFAWHPGQSLRTGAHDRGANGVWMAHGWLASDQWFMQSPERMGLLATYHNTPTVIATLQDLKNRGMGHVFLDLHPCETSGDLPPATHSGAEMLGLQAAMLRIRAWPWVGGNRGETCFPEKPEWRKTFAASCKDLLFKCPHLSGVIVNIEPWPENDQAMLALLDDLRQALPKGKGVAVAACPPPTLFQPSKSNHWGEGYFRQVAAKSDLMAVMMFDTGLKNDKLFIHLMESWTRESLQWAGKTPVLLGVADYEEPEPKPWHNPQTETLEHALAGIHAGLSSFATLPDNYMGVAVFADYTMNARKWAVWETEFCAKRKKIAVEKPPSLEEFMKGAANIQGAPATPAPAPAQKPQAPAKPLPIPYK